MGTTSPSATASQTIGPYWHLIEDRSWADLTRFGAEGENIVLTGTVYDGDGKACPDACVEIWQTDPPASETFPGFGRSNADANGTYRLVTLKPGPVPGRGNAQQAPHIAIWVLSRGVMKGLATRVYFRGDALNDSDPLLQSIEDPARRATLVAAPEGAATWCFNIHLQGENETVFLDI
jgi:protocatechuate 3,4-dioxygenase alpha subunit